jgi:putative addiction module component (TIGR02574 family)
MDFLTVEREALALCAEERARLARELLASLQAPLDDETEALWAVEASARAAQLDAGDVQGIPAAEVFRDAKALFR